MCGEDGSMSQRMKLFIFLLIVNLIVIVIYLVWNHIRRKENLRSVWMKAVMMFLCPVVGPMFVLLSFILFKLFSSQGMDLSDIVFSKDRTENFLRPDEEMERNMVSLEEALEVTDKKSLRTLMLNVIRGDYQNSLSSINLALNSKDSETAHYAASILQDVLNNFRSQVQKKYLLCQEENEQQVENCVNLVEYMNPILEQKVLTDIEQKSMTDKMQDQQHSLRKSLPASAGNQRLRKMYTVVRQSHGTVSKSSFQLHLPAEALFLLRKQREIFPGHAGIKKFGYYY